MKELFTMSLETSLGPIVRVSELMEHPIHGGRGLQLSGLSSGEGGGVHIQDILFGKEASLLLLEILQEWKECLELEEEMTDDPELPYTARLSNWKQVGHVIHGNIFGDATGCFPDGTSVITYAVLSRDKDVKEGGLIKTRNSTYLLGKSFSTEFPEDDNSETEETMG